MNNNERKTYRRIQDKYLNLPEVKYLQKLHGDKLSLFPDPNSPNLEEIRNFIYPNLYEYFLRAINNSNK